MESGTSDNTALIDLDGTVADHHNAVAHGQRLLRSPDEPSYKDRYEGGVEPDYIASRRKLIQAQPGFWRNLRPIPMGFEVVDDIRNAGFNLHVLTKGPAKDAKAWGEKVDWAREHLPDVPVTVASDKSLVYGKILFDDFSPYFKRWLAVRPRGLVICLAQLWNEDFRVGGPEEHPNVLRYDGTNRDALRARLKRAFDRKSGENL